MTNVKKAYYDNKINKLVSNMKDNIFKYVDGSQDPISYNNQLNINIPSIKGQRWLNQNMAKKLLLKKGGYDKGQYRPVLAMAVPVANAREWANSQKVPSEWDVCFDHGIEELKEYAIFLFDGQKRKYMLQKTDSSITTFPIAVVYFVKEVTEGNRLFNEFNKYQLENVSAESLFINDVLAGDEQAIELSQDLKNAGLCVADKDDQSVVPESATVDIGIPSININSWKYISSNLFGRKKKSVASAVQVIKDALAEAGAPTSGRTPISGWLLAGLSELLARRPDLLKNPEPRNGMVLGLARCLEYHEFRQKKMLDELRKEAESRGYSGVGQEQKGLNNMAIWALVLATAFNVHGKRHVKDHTVMQNATNIKSLVKEFYPEPLPFKKSNAA